MGVMLSAKSAMIGGKTCTGDESAMVEDTPARAKSCTLPGVDAMDQPAVRLAEMELLCRPVSEPATDGLSHLF